MRKMLFVLPLMLIFLSGCAMFQNVQEKWDKLTPDEQGRVILAGLQKQLNTKFEEAKVVVAANPSYQPVWKEKVVPAFDSANKSLAKIEGMAMKGAITPDQVYITFKPELDKLILYLAQLGLKWEKKEVK